MLEHDNDLLPYIGWDGEKSMKETIQEKMIHGQNSLINASITTKQQVAEELEELIKQVSYRFGGQTKIDLIKTLIEQYRLIGRHDKVKEIQMKMHDGLNRNFSFK